MAVASAQITHHKAILQKALLQKSLDRTLVSPMGSGVLSSEEREARLLASGWTSVDRALSGGFPRGECSEIVGSSSSGRTALLTTLLAGATRRGEIVALVDALDRFDPRAAVEMARLEDPLDVPPDYKKHDKRPLDLSRMLWVRGTPLSPQALGASLQARGARSQTRASPSVRGRAGARSWAESDEEPELLSRVIDRALKSFGLIAQAGGFGVVALDLADVPMTALRRLPFTTWFRLQRLIEGSQTVGILLAPEPIGRSARGVTVCLGGGCLGGGCLGPGEGATEVTRVIWNGTSDCARVLTGFALQPQVQAARRLGDQLREAVSA
jgi:hypothetical protein